MSLQVLQIGDPILRREARKLEAEEIRSDRIHRLIRSMRRTMDARNGVGLVAPQIGEPLQIIVIEDTEERMRYLQPEEREQRKRVPIKFEVLIGPEVVENGTASCEHYEGCLSVANGDLLAPVNRFFDVTVDADDENGHRRQISACGWHARIIQHEIDHLFGRLFLDWVESSTLITRDNWAYWWRERSPAELRASIPKTPRPDFGREDPKSENH